MSSLSLYVRFYTKKDINWIFIFPFFMTIDFHRLLIFHADQYEVHPFFLHDHHHRLSLHRVVQFPRRRKRNPMISSN